MIDNNDDDDIGVGGDMSIVDVGDHPRVAIFRCHIPRQWLFSGVASSLVLLSLSVLCRCRHCCCSQPLSFSCVASSGVNRQWCCIGVGVDVFVIGGAVVAVAFAVAVAVLAFRWRCWCLRW